MTRKRNNKCRNSICACTGACFVDDGTGDFAPASDRIKLERLRSRMLGWEDCDNEIEELVEALKGVLGAIKFSGWDIDDHHWRSPIQKAEQLLSSRES